jgi:hypothetical protein
LFNFWVYPVTTPFPVTNYSAGDIAFQELGVNTIVQFVKSGSVVLFCSQAYCSV